VTASLLDVEGLDVAYGDFQVLWQAAMDVSDGEIVTVLGPNGAGKSTLINTISGLITPRAGRITFGGTRIDGLPANQVAPTDPVLLARIAAEGERKAAGFNSVVDLDAFNSGFIMPVEGGRRSARFGGQRILNGEPKRPHYGVDLAAPVGTAVRAPAGGQVVFSETGLHFEGGLVLIDHGQGLITAYLHLSKALVAPGDLVRQGQIIGAVGKEGRATGPHLCWRMKWRGRNLDPSLMVAARAPRL